LKIPKIIHVSWKTKEIINSNNCIIRHGLKNLISLNPDWKLIIYEDDEIEQYLKSVLNLVDYKLYENCHIIEKLDIWRLFKIYNEGGLYIDLDRLYNIPLNDIIDEDTICILPTCGDFDFSQDIMLSEPNNYIYKKAINLILDRRKRGITNTYFLGAQTYMHTITYLLFGKVFNSNPGKEVFEDFRKKIDLIPGYKTYKENYPYDTLVYRQNADTKYFDHELEKRRLYREFGMKHWANFGL
jgi:hypothetical protein